MEYYQISLLLVDPQVEHCTIALPRTMLSLWAPPAHHRIRLRTPLQTPNKQQQQTQTRPPHHRIRLRTTQQTHIVCLLGVW